MTFRLVDLVRELNRDHGWKISEHELHILAADAAPLISPCLEPETARAVIANYHSYSGIIRSLLNEDATPWERDALAREWCDYLGRVVGHLWRSRGPIRGLEPEDVAQEAWFKILRGLRGFRYASRLETWVYTIVVRTDSEMRTAAPRRRERPVADHDPHTPDDGTPVADRIIAAEEQSELRLEVRRCLELIAGTRKRLSAWLEDYPDRVNGFSLDLIRTLLGEITQRELARSYPVCSEPTLSRIITELKEILKHRLREKTEGRPASNMTEPM